MRYKTKSVEIEAIQYTGDNSQEIIKFTKNTAQKTMGDSLIIPTLEGDHEAKVGDFIIRGLKGEFYPCKPDIFIMKYYEIS